MSWKQTFTGRAVDMLAPAAADIDFADIAHALMGLNAVKGVEIGAGFASVAQRGSAHGDSLLPGGGFATNHAGGVLGGISSGQHIEVSVAIKPTSSITTPRASIDIHGAPVEVVTKGRHDPCVGIRAAPILEARFTLPIGEAELPVFETALVLPALTVRPPVIPGRDPGAPVSLHASLWLKVAGIDIASCPLDVQFFGPPPGPPIPAG